MNRYRDRKGFTMAEMLITVAILAVLAGLAFVGITQYMRRMHQLEMDAIAKEIFVAAQNHLSMADSQGFLGLKDEAFGTEAVDAANNHSYHFVVGASSPYTADNSRVIDLMLPFGAVDETVRAGGSYIIRYQRAPALVLDVFYAQRNGRYAHTFAESEYNTLISDYSGEDKEADRRRYGTDNAVIGWYGGEGLTSGAALKAPTINVINADTLRVEVTLPDDLKTGEKLQLLVTGVTSGAMKSFDLSLVEGGRITREGTKYTVILDDITQSGMHFGEITGGTGTFSLGENITVQAKRFSTAVLTNVAVSEMKTTNSLYDTGTTVNNSIAHALISNIRHLENLSSEISGCGKNGRTSVSLNEAVQTNNLSWADFKPNDSSSPTVLLLGGGTGTPGLFRAVVPTGALKYDGMFHSVSGIKVNETGDAGLFASLLADSSVKNLELVDFDITGTGITGTGNAGALAGTATGTAVTNVLARRSVTGSSASFADHVVASGNAGGLIGSMSGGSVNYSAASLIVNGGAAAGGLIGSVTGAGSTINGCYSAGHTKDGSYTEWVGVAGHSYDVTGVTAGGLVGSSSGTITNSYSTCSVNGTTTAAGGFVGSAGGSISNCYCTGLVTGGESVPRYAFAGSGTPTISGCWYYEIINEDLDADPIYMLPYNGYSLINNGTEHQARIKAIDHIIAYYDDFVGAQSSWTNAAPYDAKLTIYYHDTSNTAQAEYNLRSIARLGLFADPDFTIPANYFVNTHYGDWPAPEAFVINKQAS